MKIRFDWRRTAQRGMSLYFRSMFRYKYIINIEKLYERFEHLFTVHFFWKRL